MEIKIKNKEYRITEIVDVDEEKDGYDVEQKDGWHLFIYKKYKVVPRVGDTLITYGNGLGHRIQGIQINDIVLYYKTDEQMKKEHEEWIRKTRQEYMKEYIELMNKIKNEPQFETVDISGMGGGYERACQLMIKAGMKFLKEKPEFHFDYQGFKNVYGLCFSDTPWAKDLDKVLSDAVGGDLTGAMHQCVIGHLQYIHKHGHKKWLNEFPKSRRYSYPLELPEPSFGKRDK